jgi:uncharacterized membrane protein YhaH (DUF805 family)
MSILLRPLLRYADFKGRASRREYFGFMLVQSLVAGLIMTVMVSAGRAENPAVGGVTALAAFGLLGLMTLGLLTPNYAVLVRRLHDGGRSAWWLMLIAPNVAAILMVVGALGGVVQAAVDGADQSAAVSALVAGLGGAVVMILIGQICGIILFVMTLLPGDAEENRFGPDPRIGAMGAGGWQAPGLDEARLEVLFEEARRGMVDTAAAARPTPALTSDRPAYDPGVVPSRPFGKRTSSRRRLVTARAAVAREAVAASRDFHASQTLRPRL